MTTIQNNSKKDEIPHCVRDDNSPCKNRKGKCGGVATAFAPPYPLKMPVIPNGAKRNEESGDSVRMSACHFSDTEAFNGTRRNDDATSSKKDEIPHCVRNDNTRFRGRGESGGGIATAAFALLLLFTLPSCRNDLKDIARIQIPDTVAGQFITNGELYYSELGRTKVRIQSPVINNYETTNSFTELPEGFYAEFLDENMEVESTITAEYGIVLKKDNVMRARRDVVVLSLKDNEQLNTEELIWDMNAKKIYTDAFVKMTSADKILFGDGFEADENFENRTIKRLRGEILVKKDEEE